jgi:hypothetical protein
MFACVAAPLMRFVAPPAQSTCRVHSTRVCLTRYVPPSGFHTLLTACSSTGCPALFHAGALMEFLPLQSFSLVRSRGASRRPIALLPFARFQPPHRLPEEAPRHRCRSCRGHAETSRNLVETIRRPQQRGREPGSTSGPCSPERVRCVAAAVRPAAGSMLSWGSHLDTASAFSPPAKLANTAAPEPLHLSLEPPSAPVRRPGRVPQEVPEPVRGPTPSARRTKPGPEDPCSAVSRRRPRPGGRARWRGAVDAGPKAAAASTAREETTRRPPPWTPRHR